MTCGLKVENGSRATTKLPLRVTKSAWYSMPSSACRLVRTTAVYRCPSPIALSTSPEYSPKLSDSKGCPSALGVVSSGRIRRLAAPIGTGASPAVAAVASAPPASAPVSVSASGSAGGGAAAKSHDATADPRKVSKTRPTKTALVCVPTERFQ